MEKRQYTERDITEERYAEAIYLYCTDSLKGIDYWTRYELEPISMIQYVYSYKLNDFWNWYDTEYEPEFYY